ncbi:MAG: hypothetical protein LBN39_12085 [Planctomycetaceae bacterium]|jgi:hypothetical protein|nr:hypothetical protein [Planctomycetaceae bacterium]
MSTITETDILQKFMLLPDAAKQRVADFIGEQIKSAQNPQSRFGKSGLRGVAAESNLTVEKILNYGQQDKAKE